MNWFNILLVVLGFFGWALSWYACDKRPNSVLYGIILIISAIFALGSLIVSFARPIPYNVDTYTPSSVTRTSDFLTVVTYNGSALTDNTAKIYSAPESNIVYVVYHYKNAWGIRLEDIKSIGIK